MFASRTCTFRAALPLRSLRPYSNGTEPYIPPTPNAPPTSPLPPLPTATSPLPLSTPLHPIPAPKPKSQPQSQEPVEEHINLPRSLAASLEKQVAIKKTLFVPPTSMVPEGGVLKGLNYLKGREDPVARGEGEYPEWLWGCLGRKEGAEESFEGDEFSKSKKTRQAAAKRQRKLQAKLLASGDTSMLEPKIPLTQQTIDLDGNAEGTVEGAKRAAEEREKLRGAMRVERRKGIKTKNYLGGFR